MQQAAFSIVRCHAAEQRGKQADVPSNDEIENDESGPATERLTCKPHLKVQALSHGIEVAVLPQLHTSDRQGNQLRWDGCDSQAVKC